MDPTGCAPGYATDRLLYASDAFPECKESLASYWVAIGISLFLRLLITILQIRIALHLRQMAIANKKPTRIPLTTVAEIAFSVISLINYVFIGLNIINAKDGSSIVLLFLVSIVFLISYFFSCLKLVHLGDRIIPRAVRNELNNKRNAESAMESDNLSSIRRDKVLLMLFLISFISFVLTMVLTVILGGIVYKGTVHIYVTIGLGLLALMNAAATCIILRQTSRVVHYIRSVNQKQKSVFGETIQNQGDGGKKVEEVIKRLHFRANMICIGESLCVPLHLVGLFMPLPWTLIVTLFAVSTIGEIGSTLLYMPPSMRLLGANKISNSTGTTTDQNNRNNRIITTPRTDQNASQLVTATRESSVAQPPM